MMKVKHSFLVFAAAFLMVMPAFAKTGVVYQRAKKFQRVIRSNSPRWACVL